MKVKKYFALITVLFLSTSSFAHLEKSWKTDKKAYKSVVPYQYSSQLIGSDGPDKEIVIPRNLLITADELKTTLISLIGSRKERNSLESKTEFRKTLRSELEKIGFAVSEQQYRANGINLIAQKNGTQSSKTVILSAHLDSVGNVGANDDAIGVAGALLVAQKLSKMKLKYNVRFVAFDEEELGLVGSKYYVSKLSDSDKKGILADIQLEMMGTNSKKDGKFHVIDCDRKESTFVTNLIAKGIQKLSLNLSIYKACTDRSDHASFWKAKIPAVVTSENFFGNDSDSCYHSSCDVVDSRLNFEYASNISNAILYAVSQMVVNP